MDAIRTDPEWKGGNYKSQPQNLRIAAEMIYLMWSNPVLRQQSMPTLAQTDSIFDAAITASLKTLDANDFLYQFDASRDYDPAPGLEKIRAPLLAINFGDDLINPPELGIIERAIKRVARGRVIVIPFGAATRGHGTPTVAAVWKKYLQELLVLSTGDQH